MFCEACYLNGLPFYPGARSELFRTDQLELFIEQNSRQGDRGQTSTSLFQRSYEFGEMTPSSYLLTVHLTRSIELTNLMELNVYHVSHQSGRNQNKVIGIELLLEKAFYRETNQYTLGDLLINTVRGGSSRTQFISCEENVDPYGRHLYRQQLKSFLALATFALVPAHGSNAFQVDY